MTVEEPVFSLPLFLLISIACLIQRQQNGCKLQKYLQIELKQYTAEMIIFIFLHLLDHCPFLKVEEFQPRNTTVACSCVPRSKIIKTH
jgi:hypothetical protein